MSAFDDFKPGDRVHHSLRGYGVVHTVVPGGGRTTAEQLDNAKMYVVFDDHPNPAIFDRPWFCIMQETGRVSFNRVGGAA